MKNIQSKKMMAIFWIFINCLIAASVPVIVKLKLSDVPIIATMTGYHAIAAVISGIWLWKIKESFKTTKVFLHIARALLIGVGYYLYFLASFHTSIANVVTLAYTTGPFTCLFAHLILKEDLTKTDLFNLFFSFLGAALIIKPNADVINIGSIFALSSAILWALSNVVIKKLTETDSTSIQLFYSNSLIFITFLPFALLLDSDITLIDTMLDTTIILLGIMIFLQFYFLVKALENAKTTIIMPFFAFAVIMGDLLGYHFLGEEQDYIEFMGTMLIIGVSVYQVVLIKLGKL